jgi:hypothetical protein
MIVCVEPRLPSAGFNPDPSVAINARERRFAFDAVSKEFPSIELRISRRARTLGQAHGGAPALERGFESSIVWLGYQAWKSPELDFWQFDEMVDEAASAGRTTLVLWGGFAPSDVAAVLTRCQRWTGRRNRASHTFFFGKFLSRHRTMFDLDQPLVVADYRHALDAWQWTLRLCAEASVEVQLAALLHDVERLSSETERRAEHHAPDYQAFKDAHAQRGAEMARVLLLEQGAELAVAERTSRLVEKHERADDDPDLTLLIDADALSFFSLNSAGYVDYFGREQARRKIRYTLHRMSPASVARLGTLRLRHDVAALLAAEVRS